MGMATWAILFSVSYFDTEPLTSETGLHRDETNVNNKYKKIRQAAAQVPEPWRQRPSA